MDEVVPGSFRDPSGFLFSRGGSLFRQVNPSYQADYDLLVSSGLYKTLVGKGWLVSHEEVDEAACSGSAFKIIKPVKIKTISYPYEWSFSQLKDAALLTLDIQQQAIKKGMSLKDASAYNVQFDQGKPIFIDTLSFEKLVDGQPWVAYKQFCQHFLAPLALMAKTDISLSQLMRTNIDGIPLLLASKLLPFSTRLSFSMAIHIHMHAKTQSRNADKAIARQDIKGSFSKNAFLALIDNLRSLLKKLDWQPKGTEWHDYYEANNNYERDSLSSKEAIVSDFVSEVDPSSVWDLGANTGRFSRIASQHCDHVCAWDIDPACVEMNYRSIRQNNEKAILPLLLDLTNPSPAIGWANDERMSVAQRGKTGLVLALGIVHHLAISNNLPLSMIASYLAELSDKLIIEFVPKSDSQVVKLLSSREDIFPDYTTEGFEKAFGQFYSLDQVKPIPDTARTLYLMSKKA